MRLRNFSRWRRRFEKISKRVLTRADERSTISSKEAPILFFLIQRNRGASFSILIL